MTIELCGQVDCSQSRGCLAALLQLVFPATKITKTKSDLTSAAKIGIADFFIFDFSTPRFRIFFPLFFEKQITGWSEMFGQSQMFEAIQRFEENIIYSHIASRYASRRSSEYSYRESSIYSRALLVRWSSYSST